MPLVCTKEELISRMADNSSMLRDLPKSLTDREYPARGSGWYGYRFKSLMERTRQFADDYCNRYYWTFGRAIEWNFDTRSPEFATQWEMRRHADVCCVPYPVYLEIGFHLFRNARYMDCLAVPNRRFAKREDSISWRKQFQKVWDTRHMSEYAKLSRIAQFWLRHDGDLPAQRACRERLVKIAKTGRRYKYIMENFAIASQIVSRSSILSLVPDECERAEIESSINADILASMIIINAEPAMEGSLLQTCFGLPRQLEGLPNPCLTCSHRPACAEAAKVLTRTREATEVAS